MGFYIALCFAGSPHALPATLRAGLASLRMRAYSVFPLTLIKECCSKWNLGRRRQETGDRLR